MTVIDGDSSITWFSSRDGVPSPRVAQNDEPAPDGDALRILLMVAMFATNPVFWDSRNRAPSAASRLYTSPATIAPDVAGWTIWAVPRACAMPFGTPVLSVFAPVPAAKLAPQDVLAVLQHPGSWSAKLVSSFASREP